VPWRKGSPQVPSEHASHPHPGLRWIIIRWPLGQLIQTALATLVLLRLALAMTYTAAVELSDGLPARRADANPEPVLLRRSNRPLARA
jgi:hypothetical protein